MVGSFPCEERKIVPDSNADFIHLKLANDAFISITIERSIFLDMAVLILEPSLITFAL